MAPRPFALGLALACLAALACSNGGGSTDLPGSCNPACAAGTTCKSGRCVKASGDAGAGGAGADGGDDLIVGKPDGGGGTAGRTDAGSDTCAAETTRAQQQPLAIYVMFDQSTSMDDGSKWDSATSAIESFVSQPLDDVSVGLQYFGVSEGGSAKCVVYGCWDDSDCGDGCGPCEWDGCAGYVGTGSDSCNAADYANPDVPIAALPGVAGALKTSLDSHAPSTLTPTKPAVQGAIDYLKSFGGTNPGYAVIAILATDGEPTECMDNASDPIPEIEAIAAAGAAGTPKVLTFVIGVGDNLENLDKIAAAGGTKAAYMVDTGANVQQQFLDSLNLIRGAALGCNYKIPVPASGTPDFAKVNVQYTPGGTSTKAIFPMVKDKASCPAAGDAWYYDNPSAPTQIVLCDATCEKVKKDTSGSMDVLLGCSTVIN